MSSTPRKSASTRSFASIVAVLGALALTACAASEGGATAASVGTYDEAELTSIVDQYLAEPTFTAPGDPIDVSSLAGEKIYVIPFSDATEFNQIQAVGAKEAAEAAGVELIHYTTNGQASEWQQGMNKAIQDDAAAIIIAGAEPTIIAPQIAEAEAAGIPVILSHAVDTTAEQEIMETVPGITATGARAPFGEAMRLVADYIALESKGAAKILFVTADDMNSAPMWLGDAFNDEIAQRCPDCTVDRVSTTSAEAATKTQTAVQAALQTHPDTTWIVPMFDFLVPYIIPALEAANATETIKIGTFNGTASVLDLVREQNPPVVLDVGEPIELMGWSTMDQTLRILLGEEPVEQTLYMRIFDESNIADAGEPASTIAGYGDIDAIKNGFRELWGVAG